MAGRVHFPLTVPEKHPFEASPFAHCPVYKGAETHSTHCAEGVFFFRRSVPESSPPPQSALVIVVTDVQ